MASGLTIAFASSNPDVLTISNSGVACAGKWDSLSNPIICTPGPAGTAMVTSNSLRREQFANHSLRPPTH